MEDYLEPNDFFIVAKDFSLNEDEEIEFLKFYDIKKKASHILIIKDQKVYECMRLSQFGSVFYGNYVYEQPTNLIIQEIDPLIFLINIIQFATKTESDKFSISLHDIVYKYMEELVNCNDKIEESEVETSKKFLNFLHDYYVNKKEELEKICEVTFSKLIYLLNR